MRLGRNDPCWCGSGKKYKNCHSEFDRKIREFEDRGHLVPSGYMIKTPAQIEGIREAGRLNTMVLDYAEQFIREGISTEELNVLIDRSPENWAGFPRLSTMRDILRVSASPSMMSSVTVFPAKIRF